MTTNNPSNTERQGGNAGPEQLREDAEKARSDLGETVDALSAKAGIKADVTARARNTFQAARAKTGPVAQQAQLKAREIATKARTTATSDDVKTQARGGGTAVATGTGAVLLFMWLRRRLRARRMSRWQSAMLTAQQTGAQMRDRATEFGSAVKESEVTAQAAARSQAAAAELAARARQAADDPETRPRAQGAAAAVAVLVVLGCLRRSRAARRRARTE
jgi:hypothetical protein